GGRGLRVNWDDRWHWVRHWIVWLDSGHRVTRHQVIWLDSGHRVIWQGSVGSEWSTGMTAGTGSDIGSSGWTAGTGSPGIRSFGSTAGTASSGKAVGSEVNRHDSEAPGHQVPDCLARQRASGHQASRSFGSTAGTGSGTGSSGSTAGHRVNWPNRIVRLDHRSSMLGRGIR
ncbi:unnamed protein product, partial [Staurois parvus]